MLCVVFYAVIWAGWKCRVAGRSYRAFGICGRHSRRREASRSLRRCPQLELRVIAKPEHSATANPINDLYGIVRH